MKQIYRELAMPLWSCVVCATFILVEVLGTEEVSDGKKETFLFCWRLLEIIGLLGLSSSLVSYLLKCPAQVQMLTDRVDPVKTIWIHIWASVASVIFCAWRGIPDAVLCCRVGWMLGSLALLFWIGEAFCSFDRDVVQRIQIPPVQPSVMVQPPPDLRIFVSAGPYVVQVQRSLSDEEASRSSTTSQPGAVPTETV